MRPMSISAIDWAPPSMSPRVVRSSRARRSGWSRSIQPARVVALVSPCCGRGQKAAGALRDHDRHVGPLPALEPGEPQGRQVGDGGVAARVQQAQPDPLVERERTGGRP
jgi:hypothetical protein